MAAFAAENDESELWKVRVRGARPLAVDNVGPTCYGKCAVLIKRPEGAIIDEMFDFQDRAVPDEIPEGTVLVRNDFLSMDPTHLIWMQDIPQYMPAVGLNTVMRALGVGRVIKTTDEDNFPVGKVVGGVMGVAEYTLLKFAEANPVVPGIPSEQNLGLFSVVGGLTAYVGYKICDPKPGKTYVVSGAAGSVGSIAAQLGKIAGARVIGIAGGPEKCAYVCDELGLDGCIDYRAESVADGLARLCPDGVDCYFDNVGGETLEAVIAVCNNFANIAFCGAISKYKDGMGDRGSGPRNFEMILMRRITIQGFICTDHLACIGQCFKELGAAYAAGQMKYRIDSRESDICDYVSVVNNLYTGGNQGKLVMKLPAANL